jgi:putative salt-induced outer membrane protein
MKMHLLLAAPALALVAASPLMAQSTITGIDDLDERLEDIETDVADDIAESEDAARFGFPEYRPGFSGSASLGFTTESGNTESDEFNLGVRLRYAQGNFVQTLGMAADYAETDGVETEEDIFAVYDANYYLNDQFYLFALARAERDGLADEEGDIARDAFIGVGPGYRIINTDQVTWRVQAGVGVSYLQNGIGESETEEAVIASSRLYYQFSPTVFMTNDTDVLNSSTALRANNDLGLNFRMNDNLTTRLSYLTDYNDARDIETDNRFGVSLVVGF